MTRGVPAPVHVEAIDSLAGLLQLGPEWRRLQDEAGELPFTSWEWNVTWWRELSRRSIASSDRPFVRAFRDPGGELIGVAPLMVRAYPGSRPAFRCLRYFGADPAITEIRGPLCRSGCAEQVSAALLEHLFDRAAEWDCFFMEGIRRGMRCPLLDAREDVRWSEEVSDYTVALPSTWEEFRRSRSRNIKESLRKCTNSLKRAGLQPTFHVASRAPEVSSALDAFFELHAARAGRADMVQHRNVFDEPRARRFLRALIAELSAVDAVRIFTMELEGRVVAARLAFRVRRSLYLYYSGFDPAYARYSVMTSVVAEAIRFAIAEGYETVNLSRGNDVSKARWSPDVTIFRQAVLPSPAARSRLVTDAYLHLRKRWLADRTHRRSTALAAATLEP